MARRTGLVGGRKPNPPPFGRNGAITLTSFSPNCQAVGNDAVHHSRDGSRLPSDAVAVDAIKCRSISKPKLGMGVGSGLDDLSEWSQVPVYWRAQLLGSILGAAITYAIYLAAIDQHQGDRNIRTVSGEHSTGRLFVTLPQFVFGSASGFGTEVTATSILMVTAKSTRRLRTVYRSSCWGWWW